MQRLLSLLSFLAILLCACAVQSGAAANAAPVDGGTQEQQKEVRAAAKILVARLDAGQYAEAWAMAGPSLTAKTTQAEFVRYISTLRAPLGAAGKRTIKGFGFPTELEDAPRGQYGVIAVETDFANAEAVEEKLVFEFVGGKWRLVGYWLSKTLTIGAAQMPNKAIKSQPLRGPA